MAGGSTPLLSFMKQLSEIIDFRIANISLSIDELIIDHLPLDVREKYAKLDRLRRLNMNALLKGWDDFSWKRAFDEGMLCEHDWEVFPEELKDFSLEQWCRDHGLEKAWERRKARTDTKNKP